MGPGRKNSEGPSKKLGLSLEVYCGKHIITLVPLQRRIAILCVGRGGLVRPSGVGVAREPPPAARPPATWTVCLPHRDTVCLPQRHCVVSIQQIYSVYTADTQCLYSRYTVSIQQIYGLCIADMQVAECQIWTKIMKIGPNQVRMAPFELILHQNRSHSVYEASGIPPVPQNPHSKPYL